MRHLILAATLAAIGSTSYAAAATKPGKTAAPAAQKAPAVIDVKVRDFSGRFMDFYEAASRPMPVPPPAPTPAPSADGKQAAAPATPPAPPVPMETEEDRRWRFYKLGYDFAPLTGNDATRPLLNNAWPRYAAVAPQIKTGFDGVATELSEMSQNMAAQFGLDKPLSIRYITYVGLFDGKVWSEPDTDRTNIYVPLEVDAATRALPLAKIMGRLMLDKSAAFGAQPRNLAELLIAEGAYAHALQAVVPGKPLEVYLGLTTEQLAKAKDARKTDLKNMIDKLADSSVLSSYSGENIALARYAGWLVVESFVKQNASYADMIRQKPSDLVRVSQVAIANLIVRAK
ncbi:hypothetical protein [Chitinimonas naiadis]